MPANPCTFVVLSSTGKVIPLPAGSDTDYFKVLLELARKWPQGPLEGQELPRTLLCDGEVVMSTGLLAAALAYSTGRASAIATIEAEVRANHTPDWLSE